MKWFLFLLLCLLMAFYFFQRRSISSWIVEKILFLLDRKSIYEEREEDSYNQWLDELAIKNDEPYHLPSKVADFREVHCDGMQVFTYNNKRDPNQLVIFYVHGGAFINQPLRQHFIFLSEISKRSDAKIVMPIYPKAPKYNYKDALAKLTKLYEQVVDSMDNTHLLILMGDSAGAGLAFSFSYYLRDHGFSLPKDLILISPLLDVRINNAQSDEINNIDPMVDPWAPRRIGEIWAGNSENMCNPYVSPFFGDMKDMPYLTIFIGTHDILLPDVRAYHRLLLEKGVNHTYIEKKKMDHVYPLMPILEAREARRTVVSIIKNTSKT